MSPSKKNESTLNSSYDSSGLKYSSIRDTDSTKRKLRKLKHELSATGDLSKVCEAAIHDLKDNEREIFLLKLYVSKLEADKQKLMDDLKLQAQKTEQEKYAKELVQNEKSEQDLSLKIQCAISKVDAIFKMEKCRTGFKYDTTKLKDMLNEEDRNQEKRYQLWKQFLKNPPTNHEISLLLIRVKNHKSWNAKSPRSATDEIDLFAQVIAEVSRSISENLYLSLNRINPVKDVRLIEDTLQNEAVNVLLGDIENASYIILFSDGSKVPV
ncbi:uncharacterized protein LOC135833977 [Planococcus citri]|uniref:uncharacterized protein LOC135833977 n=1 Tax=Planococcus citri TaxID=170843 RepID=UPI0031F9F8CE